ncbi:uncharacterized protein PGTG_22441 [Puccinia graminis f. sp. tritici CRL 75-36-700-3]|uniref:Chromatin modification-related protein n=1 Tax=Puccinia graminis f. sp. tritici (strain CRL 75-36-700-3 / race SCCL) TaxID=418459 RepID=H6QUG2_PUCGT|nr:uncharacterized protein PGTG_22441 [Puccinia graminis f. sp. tritici CRL 75-36-700-3]EHS64625.1 hypothetical protein PGTG_22441 [Puccinia graminis f. sp. tritici CRL 75-36-700-3]
MPPKSTTAAAAAKNQQQQQNNNNQQTNKSQNELELNSKAQQQKKKTDQETTRMAIEQFAESVHLVESFADTLDAIPPSLTRSLSDLKELDAVLTTPLNQLHSRLDQLIHSLKQPKSINPQQRLQLLRSIISDIERYRLGAQDKIRVANGTCESLSHHIRQLDTTTSLLISSLPPSLESRIPPSTFPTGYPKLTGSLRSKPIGGVWQNSNPSNLQQPSPPSIPAREFINFYQGSPGRQINSQRPFDPHQPLSKRPRLGASGQSHQAGDDPSLLRRDHQAETGSKLLDQHIYSQSVLDKHRTIHEDNHQPSGPPRPGGKTASLARQHSQIGLTSPNPSLNAPVSKNKRSRISSGLAEPETEDWSNPSPKLNPASQQAGAVGPKKRVRKSNPAGSVAKNAPAQQADELGSSAKPSELKANGLPSTASTSPSSHPTKSTTVAPVGGAGRKAVTGVRQTLTKADGPAGAAAPAPAKRAYTKRSGLTNPGTAAGGPKGKRANAKKAVGGTTEGGSGEAAGKEPATRKAEGPERGRKAATKETVRLDDVAEAGAKPRQRKSALHDPSQADQSASARRDKEARNSFPSRDPPEFDSLNRPAHEDQLAAVSNGDPTSSRLTKTQSAAPSRKRKNHRSYDLDQSVQVEDGHSSDGSNHSSSTKAYCICKGEVHGDRMVACDNSECPIEWFHYQCAGLTEDPTGNWFCPDCQAQGFGSTSVCPPGVPSHLEDGPARPVEQQQPVPPPPAAQPGPLPETSFVVPSDDPVVGGRSP